MAKNKIMITGGTGFLGASLLPALISSGYEVATLVRKTSLVNELPLDVVKYVINPDLESVVESFEVFRPDLVIHAATYFSYAHSSENLKELSESNLIFPINLLEAMNITGCKKLLNIGSMWQFNEKHERIPVNLYAAMKNSIESVMAFYSRSLEFKVATLYLSDTYGPNDRRKKIVDLLIEKAIGRDNEPLGMSQGYQRLDLLHISDVVSAILILANIFFKDELISGKSYQLYPNKNYSLREIVAVIDELTEEKMQIDWGKRPYRLNEVMEVSRIFERPPGWQEQVSLRQGILDLILRIQ